MAFYTAHEMSAFQDALAETPKEYSVDALKMALNVIISEMALRNVSLRDVQEVVSTSFFDMTTSANFAEIQADMRGFDQIPD
jgi:hypothetical protein